MSLINCTDLDEYHWPYMYTLQCWFVLNVIHVSAACRLRFVPCFARAGHIMLLVRRISSLFFRSSVEQSSQFMSIIDCNCKRERKFFEIYSYFWYNKQSDDETQSKSRFQCNSAGKWFIDVMCFYFDSMTDFKIEKKNDEILLNSINDIFRDSAFVMYCKVLEMSLFLMHTSIINVSRLQDVVIKPNKDMYICCI